MPRVQRVRYTSGTWAGRNSTNHAKWFWNEGITVLCTLISNRPATYTLRYIRIPSSTKEYSDPPSVVQDQPSTLPRPLPTPVQSRHLAVTNVQLAVREFRGRAKKNTKWPLCIHLFEWGERNKATAKPNKKELWTCMSYLGHSVCVCAGSACNIGSSSWPTVYMLQYDPTQNIKKKQATRRRTTSPSKLIQTPVSISFPHASCQSLAYDSLTLLLAQNAAKSAVAAAPSSTSVASNKDPVAPLVVSTSQSGKE